jgi:cell division transport system permease protein
MKFPGPQLSRPEDRLLPEGRLSGPMPWIIAIMIFLTVLAGAVAITLGQSAVTLSDAVSNRLTIQVTEPDAQTRAQAVATIRARLHDLPGIARADAVPHDELVAQLEPWLGADLKKADIPIPALIDVDLAGDKAKRDAAIGDVVRIAAGVSPRARVESHATYLQPVAALVRTIGWIALGIVGLMAFATACTVVLAARAAHATHHSTIEILHMLGATDQQVTRLFQRRMTLDASYGAAVGLTSAITVILIVRQSLDLLASELVSSASLPGWGWGVLIILPLAFIMLAWAAARVTLFNALGRAL